MSLDRQRFAEVVRREPIDLGLACLLIGREVDPLLDLDIPLRMLDALARAVRVRLPMDAPPAAASAVAVAEALRVALGETEGFAGFAGDFESLDASLLHDVLATGRGLPLLLSVVWLEVCRRLDIPARAVALPGRVVVALGPEASQVVVDPFAGGLTVPPDVLRVTTPAELGTVELLLRLLTNVRALTTRQPPGLRAAVTRLWAVEVSLLLPRHPAQLRRERGELLVRLGRHVEGAEELETYALVVEDADEAAAIEARRSARMARAQLN